MMTISRRAVINGGLVLATALLVLFLYNRYRVAPDLAFGQLPLQNAAGKPASLNAYRGKVIVLNFWASWCPDCLREMPALARLQQQFSRDDVAVVLITDESPEKLATFLAKHDYPLTFLRSLQPHKTAGIHALPCTYLIDRKGKVIYSVMGETVWDSPAQVERIKALVR